MTLEEFDQLRHHDGIEELLDRMLVEAPPPTQRHSEICKNVVNALRRVIDDSRIRSEAGFVIGPQSLQPDVSVIFPGQRIERGWFSGSPMIAERGQARNYDDHFVRGALGGALIQVADLFKHIPG
jgi:Uma2 family endonuclease